MICLFEVWEGFASKLEVCIRDIPTETFRYFKHLKAFSVDHEVNAVKTDMYMRDQTSQFCNTLQNFQHFDSLFSFFIKPESSEDLNLSAFE